MSVPYLAKYDFRTKQQYIYRTNAICEIAGASSYIACSYERFLNRLKALGMEVERNYTWDNGVYVNNVEAEFNPSFDKDGCIGKVVYVGGGNLIILWKDLETAKTANGIFCELLLDEAPGLSPVCGLAKYTGDYGADYEVLNAAFAEDKRLQTPMESSAMLPFTEVDRRTSLPILFKGKRNGRDVSLSGESLSKLRNYDNHEIHTQDDGTKQLDELVTKKGEESLLAIIYIDGNGMGDRVRKCMSNNGEQVRDYSEAVKRIRMFSNMIHNDYVMGPMKHIAEYLETIKDVNSKYRLVVANGDEVTIICNARAALAVTRAYFEALNPQTSGNSSCAGIAIFHSHAPFATVYSIAEECCENAKKLNRKNRNGNCLVDFQFCYSGITGDLDTMREQDKERMCRPYYISKSINDEPCKSLDKLLELGKKLSAIGRANIKELSKAAIIGEAEYLQELYRIRAHIEDGKEFDLNEEEKAMLFDVAQFYDIWFSKEV